MTQVCDVCGGEHSFSIHFNDGELKAYRAGLIKAAKIASQYGRVYNHGRMTSDIIAGKIRAAAEKIKP